MKIQLVPVAAAQSHNYFELLADSLDIANADYAIIRGGFAYVTLGGVQQFLSIVESRESWRHIRKEFLIGVHHAISEPSALEVLRNIPHAQVRVFIPGGRMGIDVFTARPVFHPKVLAISASDSGCVSLLQAGSANMTVSAIGDQPKNYEFSVAFQAEGSESVDSDDQFNKWWSDVWNQSREVDRSFIRRYEELRRNILEQNPILRSAIETPQSIAEAEYLFLEVGAGSGPPASRHQVEFPESLVRFFGKAQRRRRDIVLRHRDQVWHGRPLSYKRTTYGVQIWRLGMPTQNSGGIPVANRAIRFKRTLRPEAFEFEVVDVDNDQYRDWVRSANLNGHLGSTRGQRARQYGFYW